MLLLSILVPGLCSVLIRGRHRLVVMIILWAVPVASFFIFGPLWGEVLFRHTPYAEVGVYPFMIICFAVAITSVGMGLHDWEAVRSGRIGSGRAP